MLRGILTPVGHGLWTAILGGVLFRTAARRGRLRLTGALVGWYLVVAGLHALWDAARPIAVWLTLLLTGHPGAVGADPDGPGAAADPGPGPHLHHPQLGAAAGRRVVGVLMLRGRWRQATTPERLHTPASLPPVTTGRGQG